MIIFIQQVLQWWLVLFLLGVIVLPFVQKLFTHFFDKGYILSKIIGLIIISYCAMVVGTLHLLPFTFPTLLGITGVLLIAAVLWGRKNKSNEIAFAHWKIFLFEEVIFFTALSFWAYIKSFQPDIHGLEKFMDYGFLNSILRSTYFPPKDMWMTPLSINYYYFGHLMTAVATRLSLLPSNITFNLMLASLFAFTFTQSFSFGANIIYLLKNKAAHAFTLLAAGLITAFFLTFGGNLHTIYTLFTPYQNEFPVPPTQLAFSPLTFPNQYWYPNATRFIYHTIHEFPIYSFVVSDLHGHVLDIPAVLLMLSLLLVYFFDPPKKYFWHVVVLGSLTGIMYMTNAWDGLIYVGATAVLLFTTSFRNSFMQTIFSKKFLFSLLILFGSFVVISLPFSLFFKPFASQVGINCAPDFLIRLKNIGPLIFEQGYCQFSPPWQLLILYGFFFFWFFSLVIFLKVKKIHELNKIDTFMIGLGILGCILIIVPEFVYLKDIYTTYFRANTMFKLVYQSFILLSLVSGYTFYRIFLLRSLVQKNFVRKFLFSFYALFSIGIISLVLIYPYFAIMSYFNNLKNFQGLDGTMYLKNINIDDYHAIGWLNSTIKNQPVVLEAQGDSYTDYERISSNTGLPTVFGWMVHEWLWRGTYDIVPGRIDAVKTIYESPSLESTKSLLEKYHVSYVYVGDLERSKYPELHETKFSELGKVVYASVTVRIYKIN